jgi:hypothetical protein
MICSVSRQGSAIQSARSSPSGVFAG